MGWIMLPALIALTDMSEGEDIVRERCERSEGDVEVYAVSTVIGSARSTQERATVCELASERDGRPACRPLEQRVRRKSAIWQPCVRERSTKAMALRSEQEDADDGVDCSVDDSERCNVQREGVEAEPEKE
jgi:type VI protein secretion system component VasA